jgi:hypothetical protein
MVNQVALVSESKRISHGALSIVSAAIQKQVSRDLGPIWNIQATVDAFEKLEDVPLGYWQLIIMDKIPYDAAGIHLNRDNGQPYALVQYSSDWSLTTSHEALEMLVDPSGNRTVATNSPKPDQGRVLILVEVSDPSEAAEFGYSVNGVVVSDFYTPNFFDPVTAPGVRYSYTGAIKEPRQVLEGGYISWWDPVSTHVFQLFVDSGKQEFKDQGEFPAGFGTLRSFTDSITNQRRADLVATPPRALMLTAAFQKSKQASIVDTSTEAAATSLRRQISSLLKKSSKVPAKV